MTFDEEYPTAEPGKYIDFNGDEYIKARKPELCWNCQRATYWYSTSFMAPLCSEKCATEKWNEYWEATSGTRRKDLRDAEENQDAPNN